MDPSQPALRAQTSQADTLLAAATQRTRSRPAAFHLRRDTSLLSPYLSRPRASLSLHPLATLCPSFCYFLSSGPSTSASRRSRASRRRQKSHLSLLDHTRCSLVSRSSSWGGWPRELLLCRGVWARRCARSETSRRHLGPALPQTSPEREEQVRVPGPARLRLFGADSPPGDRVPGRGQLMSGNYGGCCQKAQTCS